MINKLLLSSELKKNLFISVLGAGAGQVIHLAFTPILSRVYDPTAFGYYSLFLSFLGILTTFTLLKLDFAIIVSADNEVGPLKGILDKLGNIISALVLIAALTLLIAGNKNWIIFLILAPTLFFSNRYWATRAIINKSSLFKILSSSKIIENLTNGLSALLLSITYIKDYGLLIGKLLSLFIAAIFFKKYSKKLYKDKTAQTKKEIFTKYKNFPKYSFPAELLVHLNLNSSIFLYTYFFSITEAGLIGLTTRVLSIPANFISISFLDVFRQRATEDYKKNKSFDTIFKKFFIILTTIALTMIATIYTLGPDLFSFVFGPSWHKAGVYAKYLSIFYAFRLVTGPLSYSFEITNDQKFNFFFQATSLVVGVTSILISYYSTGDDIISIITYSLSLSVVYSIQLLFAYLNSKKR